eukprot:gi/632986360/ref/XP_007910193.1/ PREDICTED: protein angel homolog 1 [Callorhinchus milii]
MLGSILCYVLLPLAKLLNRITGRYDGDEPPPGGSTSSVTSSEEMSDDCSTPRLSLHRDQTMLLQEWLHGGAIEGPLPHRDEEEGDGAEWLEQDEPWENRDADEAFAMWQEVCRASAAHQAGPGWPASIDEDPSIMGWQLAPVPELGRGWQLMPSQGTVENYEGGLEEPEDGMNGTESDGTLPGMAGWPFHSVMGMNGEEASLWELLDQGGVGMMGMDPCEELLRVWEELPGPPHTDQAFEFTIMSYNILSQDLLEMNGSLYTHCPPDYLTWDFRCQNILREFDTWTPDILCLQEVQEDYFQQHLQQALELRGAVEYLRPGVETLDRDNVGLLLLLQPQDEESPQAWPPICVANTHLIYNPRRGDIKLAQLALLFAEIDRLAGLGSGAGDTRCPVILCGDMNSAPHSPLYQFIQDGQLDYYGMPAWKVSNQEDSSHRLHQRRLYEPLWPRNLGITDHCQYRSQSDRSQPGEYERDFLLSLRYSAPALERPHGLIFIEGVSDTKPDAGNLKHKQQSLGSCLDSVAPGGGMEGDTHADEIFCTRSRRLISHGLNLTSVYSHYQSDSKQPEVTTCTSNSCLTVDYIFFSSQTQGGDGDGDVGLRPQARLSLLSEEDLWTANGLPNGTCSSDHLCLLARFGLEPRGQ